VKRFHDHESPLCQEPKSGGPSMSEGGRGRLCGQKVLKRVYAYRRREQDYVGGCSGREGKGRRRIEGDDVKMRLIRSG
jgi:hypothetical protein